MLPIETGNRRSGTGVGEPSRRIPRACGRCRYPRVSEFRLDLGEEVGERPPVRELHRFGEIDALRLACPDPRLSPPRPANSLDGRPDRCNMPEVTYRSVAASSLPQTELTALGRGHHMYCNSHELVLDIVSRKDRPWCGLLLGNVGDGRASQRDVASPSA